MNVQYFLNYIVIYLDTKYGPILSHLSSYYMRLQYYLTYIVIYLLPKTVCNIVAHI